MDRRLFRFVVLWAVLVIVSTEDQCPAKSSHCQCDFSSDAEDGGEAIVAEATTKSEALAAAAGAMSPLLIGGAGFGIWKLLKGRGGDSTPGFDRSNSNLSDTSSASSLPPPKYSSRRGSKVASLMDEPENDYSNKSNWGSNPSAPPVQQSPKNDDINSWMF